MSKWVSRKKENMAKTLRCEHHGSKKAYKEGRGESKTTGIGAQDSSRSGEVIPSDTWRGRGYAFVGGTRHGIMYERVNGGMHLVWERVSSSSACSSARSLRHFCLVKGKGLSEE